MTKVCEYEKVGTPAEFATAFLAGYFGRLEKRERFAPFKLRVPVRELGLPGALEVERDVVARVGWVKSGHIDQGLTITWDPESGGLFPTFTGRLVASSAGKERSLLALVGDYTPPLGIAGNLFDGAIGRWIARATAHDLLQRLRDAAEADYAQRQGP